MVSAIDIAVAEPATHPPIELEEPGLDAVAAQAVRQFDPLITIELNNLDWLRQIESVHAIRWSVVHGR